MSNLNENSIDFLWRSFLKGDDKSFSVIYQQQIDALLTYGHKLCSDHDLVNDSVQEIFMDLFLKRKKLTIEIGNLKSYLFVALRNSLGKKLKKSRKFDSLNTGDDNQGMQFQVEYSFQDQIIELEISKEKTEMLRAAINSLPDRQKEIIYLRFEEEMDYSDISGILDISVESARKLLYRSILSLRKILSP